MVLPKTIDTIFQLKIHNLSKDTGRMCAYCHLAARYDTISKQNGADDQIPSTANIAVCVVGLWASTNNIVTPVKTTTATETAFLGLVDKITTL